MFKEILILVLAFVMLSCAESKEDKVGDAQFCLDQLTDFSQDKVNACVTPLEGDETSQAYMIRCSANFIIEGFADPNKFVSALNQLKTTSGSGGSSNPTTAMMGVLTFKSQADSASNREFAQTTFNYCKLSKSAGATLIASFSNMATMIVSSSSIAATLLEPGHVITPEEVQAAIPQLAASSNEVLGATVQAAYTASCATGSETNAQLCETLSVSVGTITDQAVIGAALRELLSSGTIAR